ncbi:MAG: histidine phosphotransferase ChpT [Candidatus Tokpelaia sp. JSC188]|nr:MAG: histidine phosphotransferase ChpT [Candidatus Tokpelaia sp. JSC188]
MPLAILLSATDLSALLCSRICHDLISPIGAINNAIELYDEGIANEDALQLIRTSGVSASDRLQFMRIAFGEVSKKNTEINTSDVRNVARQYMSNEKTKLSWNGPDLLLPKKEVKLLLNLILLADASIPRGGHIDLTLQQKNQYSNFRIVCTGTMLLVPPKFMELYGGTFPEESIDVHSIQFYYTLWLAEITKMPLQITITRQEITFCAR